MSTLALPGPAAVAQLTTLEQITYGYLARCKNQGTLRAYQEDLKNYFAWCQQQNINPLTVKRAHLDLYVRWMQAQNRWAESTISRRMGTVGGMYKYAAVEEFIERDPAAGVERPSVDREKQHRTFLTPVEFAQVLQAAQRSGATEHALVALLGMMGLRIAEACSLNVDSLVMTKGYPALSFVGKGNRAAVAAVPIPVMRALDDVIAGRDVGPLLLNRRGERMDRPAAARMLRRASPTTRVWARPLRLTA